MIAYTDDDKTTLLLASRLADKRAPSIPTGAWWSLVQRLSDEGRSISSLLDDPAIADDPGRVERLASMGGAMGVALEGFASRGIQPIPHTSERFPRRLLETLGDRCPPVLFVVGDLGLLDGGGLGIVGSRDVDQDGAEVATAAARAAAEHGIPVISGAARGVDQLAMAAAVEVGGAVVGFVADSLTKRVRDGETRRLVADGRLTFASAQHPDAPFSPGSAMERNKLIYATSNATLVVATADGEGGTWAGATESLKHGYAPVLVHRGPGEGPGNAALVDRGARPVEALAAIFDPWPPAAPEPAPVQESFFT